MKRYQLSLLVVFALGSFNFLARSDLLIDVYIPIWVLQIFLLLSFRKQAEGLGKDLALGVTSGLLDGLLTLLATWLPGCLAH